MKHQKDETDVGDSNTDSSADNIIIPPTIVGDTELNDSFHMSQLEMSMGDFVQYAARSNLRGYSGGNMQRQESVEEEDDSYNSDDNDDDDDDDNEDEQDEAARYVEKEGGR